MKLKSFLWTSEIIISFCWILFFLIINVTNPVQSSWAVFFLFFIVLFVAIGGTYGLLELRWKMKKRGLDMIRSKIISSIRHGVMISVVLVGLLVMRSIDVLTAWDGIIFALAILLLEAYFSTSATSHSVEQ